MAKIYTYPKHCRYPISFGITIFIEGNIPYFIKEFKDENIPGNVIPENGIPGNRTPVNVIPPRDYVLGVLNYATRKRI